jgi:hypothetical protein
MAKSSVTNPRCPGRRQFLRTAAGGAAGLASILALRQPPAYAQTRELTFLTIASFVPETDKELKRQFEEWGAKNKVKVRLDIIAHLQLQTKKAAEVQARSGHDLTALGPGLGDADLYFDHLTDLSAAKRWMAQAERLSDPRQVGAAAMVAATVPDGHPHRPPRADRREEPRHLGGLAADRQEGEGDRASVRHRARS